MLREFESLEELIKYENPSDKSIESLTVIVYRNSLQILYLRFSKLPNRNVNIEQKGDERQVADTHNFLETQFQRMSPWYSFIIKSGVKSFLLDAFVGGTIITLPLLITFDKLKKNGYVQSDYVFLLFIAIGAFFLGGLLFLIKYKFFPTGVFAIGQGEKRHNNYDIYRTVFIIGFLINILAGIVLAFFT